MCLVSLGREQGFFVIWGDIVFYCTERGMILMIFILCRSGEKETRPTRSLKTTGVMPNIIILNNESDAFG
jgi:hypothetical protein